MVAEISRADLGRNAIMTNLYVNFTDARWLLLLIPAVIMTLGSYFKLKKRYRFTRNRIVSIVMHLIIMLLAIILLAGMTVEYYTPNTETEVILLVDTSDTTKDTETEMDSFIKTAIEHCDSMFKMGIVKFGYDQVYAAKLTGNTSRLYSEYLSSENPDGSATDIASALNYTAELFKNPENARIVLMTDALETDEEASNTIKSLEAKGISVDVVYLPGKAVDAEVQIIDVTQSTPKIEVNTAFNMDVTLQSSYAGTATITPYDNNIPGTAVQVELVEGVQTFSIPYSFAWGGMHIMTFEVASEGDTLAQNNTYVSYIYIETFTEILVIESIPAESESIVSMLGEELNVKVVNVNDANQMPTTLDALRDYDEVLLVNISNDDLPEGFDEILYEYVHDIGGGLFTVCGNEADSGDGQWTANAYTREDMYATKYQELLPVEIVNYTAPVGVVIVVDTSGSMLGSTYEESKLYWALQGALACLDALTERDYVGIMTLADAYTEELALTPRTRRDKILATIADLEEAAKNNTLPSGGTRFSAALKRAGQALAARSDIEKKHIILVTDGAPSADDREEYEYWASENAKLGVTMSIVGVGARTEDRAKMINLLVNYAGRKETDFVDVTESNLSLLPIAMRENLEVPEIKSVNYETFTPQINVYNAITNGIDAEEMPTLDGYYGVKLKEGAQAILMGKYTPIYSQWDCGLGRVGTFACDLNGTWSKEFVSSDVGKTLLNNMVYALFPTDNIRASDVEAAITGDNYTTNLSIFTDLADGEYVKVTITSPTNVQQVLTGDKISGYSRMRFATKESGLHTIQVQKMDAQDQELAYTILYKTLSYSKEYNGFADTAAAQALAESLASATGGQMITDPTQVFENAVEYLHVVIDPRIPFAIMIIACFLVDIFARKFKWKWPHEILRDRKRRMALSK